jgi:hypothetical protein
MTWLVLFRLLAILVAGVALGSSIVRIVQWWPIRKRVGIGPTLFFAAVALSAASSLYYRVTSIAATAPFSPRDALSTIILGLFVAGLTAPPVVLAELEVKEGGRDEQLP